MKKIYQFLCGGSNVNLEKLSYNNNLTVQTKVSFRDYRSIKAYEQGDKTLHLGHGEAVSNIITTYHMNRDKPFELIRALSKLNITELVNVITNTNYVRDKLFNLRVLSGQKN